MIEILKQKFKNLNNTIKDLFKNYGLTFIFLIISISLGVLIITNDNNTTRKIEIMPTTVYWIVGGFCVFFFILAATIIIFRKEKEEKGFWWYDFILRSYKHTIVWLIPIIGVLGYIMAYSGWIGEAEPLCNYYKYRDIAIKISDVLIIGGVVGFLTNSAQFLGVFKNELEGIIYSTKMLSLRKDISEIWKNASTAMFEKKFPDISEDLFDMIKNNYICKDEYSYYDNYKTITDVNWDDDEKKFLKVTDQIIYDLVTEKEGVIEITIKAWIDGVKNLRKDSDYYCTLKCFINDKEYQVEKKENFHENGNIYETIFVLHINNKNNKEKYVVKMTRERRYLFSEDFDISFRARYIVKNMDITLNIPDDLNARFLARGTTDDFISVKNTKTEKNYIYKGLVLQRQGYTFALHKDTTN